MDFNYTIEGGDPVEFNSKLPWGNTFHRSNAQPLDRTSLFVSQADALNYAQGKADKRMLSGTSYPGQIITVLDGTTPKVFIISNHAEKSQRKLIPIGEGGSTSQSQTSGTCGDNCCAWINNPIAKEAVLSDEDKWLFVDGQEHALPEGMDANAIETTITVDDKEIKGFRCYVPAHTEDESGKWVEGSWSNWSLVKVDGTEITIKTQTFADNQWILNDGDDNYMSESVEGNETVIVVMVTKEGTVEKYLAHRTWILD